MSRLDINRKYAVGDKVLTDSGESAEVIETRMVQQLRVRYKAGHESVFYTSFTYEPFVEKAEECTHDRTRHDAVSDDRYCHDCKCIIEVAGNSVTPIPVKEYQSARRK